MGKIINIGLIVLVLLSLVLSSILYFNRTKVAYVQVQEVYNDFSYKKELEKGYDKVVASRKKVLDSLEIQINALGRNIQNSDVNKEKNIERYQFLATTYQQKEKTFQEDNEMMLAKYTEQIWEQLNKYIKEFGEKEGYDFVYGASGNGTIMHADGKHDITQEMTAFVNERYAGGTVK